MQKWTINEKGKFTRLRVCFSVGIVREKSPNGLTHIHVSIYVHRVYVHFSTSIPWKRGYVLSGGRKSLISFGDPSCG